MDNTSTYGNDQGQSIKEGVMKGFQEWASVFDLISVLRMISVCYLAIIYCAFTELFTKYPFNTKDDTTSILAVLLCVLLLTPVVVCLIKPKFFFGWIVASSLYAIAYCFLIVPSIAFGLEYAILSSDSQAENGRSLVLAVIPCSLVLMVFMENGIQLKIMAQTARHNAETARLNAETAWLNAEIARLRAEFRDMIRELDVNLNYLEIDGHEIKYDISSHHIEINDLEKRLTRGL